MNKTQVEHIILKKAVNGNLHETTDQVAIEEPLGIQLIYSTATGRMQKNIAVTMRTPGNDEELAAGFLFTEGILSTKNQVKEIHRSTADENLLMITLHENIKPQLQQAERNFFSTSSCGICGKASIDAIRVADVFLKSMDTICISASVLYSLQDKLRQHQTVFENTGGIHASALFAFTGDLILMREDIGRHNALDKVIGNMWLLDQLPLNNCILLLSGRASFELLQKASMAGIKVVAAVGAPSSLAVELAKESGITLIGFLRNDRFNIYCGEQRVEV